jgi:cardiolipin synthase
LEALEHAQKRVRITNAYLMPDNEFRLALLRAAARGVDVQILLPWESNHILADWVARHFFPDYLRGGIRLFGYQGGMIHAKTATIDGVWSTIGTANLDRMSLWGNYEINVEVFNPGVASQMENIFEHDLINAHEITLEEWLKRPWYTRASELVISPLRPWG